MATIINFPDPVHREWKEWEVILRQQLQSEGIRVPSIEHALPRIREHWTVIFEPIDLELPKRPVPGTLTQDQAEAIQSIIDASARLVVERLQNERKVAFQRLVHAELALSEHLLSGSSSK